MAGLNKSEFDSLVGLLARAHYHGDTAMLEQHVTKAYDGLVKESGVPTSDLPPVPGAMTDGSKRRLTADSVLDEFDNFEFVEDPEEILAHKLELEAIRDEVESSNTPVVPPMAIGQYGAATAAVNRGGIQGSVPLPKGVLSDEEWSLTLPCVSFQLLPRLRCLMNSCVIVPERETRNYVDMGRRGSAKSKLLDHAAARGSIAQRG